MINKIVVPPLKSQGIKTKLIPFIHSLVPEVQQGRWIEPFMGTGVVGFNLAQGEVLMSDSNPHIVRFYNAIKDGEITASSARQYLRLEGELLRRTEGDHYYVVRARFNEYGDPLDFLFLTRSCFNGVMRFNRNGRFNVPFCKKPDRFSQAYITKITNQIDAISAVIRLGEFTFRECDYVESISIAKRGDIIYCDPPYIARHTDYFNSWDEQCERKLASALSTTDASFILSTWSHNDYRVNHFIDEVWGAFPRITREHFYHVGAKETNRGRIIEALVYSPDLEPHAMPEEIVAMVNARLF